MKPWWHKVYFPVWWWYCCHTWHPNCKCYITTKATWTQRISLYFHGFKLAEDQLKMEAYIRCNDD